MGTWLRRGALVMSPPRLFRISSFCVDAGAVFPAGFNPSFSIVKSGIIGPRKKHFTIFFTCEGLLRKSKSNLLNFGRSSLPKGLARIPWSYRPYSRLLCLGMQHSREIQVSPVNFYSSFLPSMHPEGAAPVNPFTLNLACPSTALCEAPSL